MSRWATSFSRVRPALGLLAALLAATAAEAKVLRTVDQALRLAFPDCEIERDTVFLTEAEVEAVGELTGEPRTRALAVRYIARRGGELVGTGYFDTHRVRTLDETVFIVVLPDETIGRIEVISFDEPMDYLPREGWYRQFAGEALDDDLQLDRGIHAVSGATMSATAATAAARRALALHHVLARREADR